jgi:hypothetical protein
MIGRSDRTSLNELPIVHEPPPSVFIWIDLPVGLKPVKPPLFDMVGPIAGNCEYSAIDDDFEAS